MPKHNRPPIFLKALSWWSICLVGVAIGIFSQRIPETRSEFETFLRPFEESGLFKHSSFEFNHQTSQLEQPISSFIIHRNGYSLAYDGRTKNPLWVYEHLTSETLNGEADRTLLAFREDPFVPEHLRSNSFDYKGKGLDQGHMAAAANHRSNTQEMDETFYLTNICPQCPQLNREYWLKLEKEIRNLTKKYAHIYVITGPLFLPYQEGKRRFVKYEVIGKNEVAVPSHFFKVIITENQSGKKEISAFILPNAFIPFQTPFEKFAIDLKTLEKKAGMLLLTQK